MPRPELSTVGSDAHQTVVYDAAAAAVTIFRGPCTGPLVSGPVTVSASGGREAARVGLVKALQAAGVRVQAAGGTVVHLVGYGDRQTDLSMDAAVTVMMDTPYLLAGSRSPTLLATYSSSPLSLTALANVLAKQGHAAREVAGAGGHAAAQRLRQMIRRQRPAADGTSGVVTALFRQ
nr:hypothetical protein GCM10020092_089070 [Actinoplanes digitatis]